MADKRIRSGEGFLWIGLGAFISIVSWETGFGVVSQPGPGFVAFVAGLCMAGLGLLMIGASFATKIADGGGRGSGVRFSGVPWIRLTYVTALLFAYAALIERLGFILTTFFVLWALLFDWGRKNWLRSFLVAGATAALSYLVFEKLLSLPFPPGIFG